jgi:plastocyanin
MALLSLGFTGETPASPTFPDVPQDHWAYGYVEGAVKHGLVKGYPDGSFQPSGKITIAEVLTVIVRAQGWPVQDLPTNYTIVIRENGTDHEMSVQDWFAQYIGAAATHLMILFPDLPQVSTQLATGCFAMALNNPASRAQTALFLDRMPTTELPPPPPGTPSSSPSTTPATVLVDIKDFSFQPATVTIQAGDTVTWTNRDSATHTVKLPDQVSPSLSQGQSWSFTFTKAGTYDYSCGIHPSMTGTVVVK